MLKQTLANAIAATLLVGVVALIYENNINIWLAIGLGAFVVNTVESLLKKHAGLGRG